MKDAKIRIIGGFDPELYALPCSGSGVDDDGLANGEKRYGDFWKITKTVKNTSWGNLDIGDDLLAIVDNGCRPEHFTPIKVLRSFSEQDMEKAFLVNSSKTIPKVKLRPIMLRPKAKDFETTGSFVEAQEAYINQLQRKINYERKNSISRNRGR